MEQYRGKVVLLDFWATWCGPCRAQTPRLVEIYRRHKSQGLEIISISLDEAQDRDLLLGVVKKDGMAWRHVFEGKGLDGEIVRSYGVGPIPLLVLIGKDGRVAAINPAGKALEQAVQAALEKQ